MTVRPIDMQVVLSQQANVAGHEQALQNVASQVKAQDLQKIPDKTHERETQIEKQGDANPIQVGDQEAERKKKGSKGKRGGTDQEEEKDTKKNTHEDGKGVRFDATT